MSFSSFKNKQLFERPIVNPKKYFGSKECISDESSFMTNDNDIFILIIRTNNITIA